MGADRKTNSFNKSMRNAKTDPCPNLAHKWIAGDWTGCSESACGDSDEAGTQTRTITCAKHVKTCVPSSQCDLDRTRWALFPSGAFPTIGSRSPARLRMATQRTAPIALLRCSHGACIHAL